MSFPKVVHCKRDKYTVYIGRGSKWGNNYSHKNGTLAKVKVATVEEALERYEADFLKDDFLIRSLNELREEDILGCFCKFKGDELCHGDIIVKLWRRFVKGEQV